MVLNGYCMWKRFLNSRLHRWLLVWKPIHLCWWFEKHGKPIPKYFIGGGATAPSVTTNAATDIQTTQATGNGNITSDGGATITARGFVFSETSVNNNPTIGGTGVTNIVEGGTATGVYSDTLTPLVNGTGYSYKAYATNSKGTGYGSVQTFTTKSIVTKTVTSKARIFQGGITKTSTAKARVGNQIYSMEGKTPLPTATTDLATVYTQTQLGYVADNDDVFVDLEAGDYMIHQFKYRHTANSTFPTVTVRVKSTLAPTASTVYLQVYNFNTSSWTTIDSDNTTGADTEFELTGSPTGTEANFYQSVGSLYQVVARVYQEVV